MIDCTERSSPVDVQFQVSGVGHCVGSRIVSNRDLAISLGLEPNWFETRTGISHRRICADGEDVLQMARKLLVEPALMLVSPSLR